MFGDEPALGKDHEIDVRGASLARRRCQDRKNGRVGVIEQNGSNRRESAKVIFVGRVIAMPRDDVERRMADLSDMEAAAPFYRQAASCFLLLVGRHRNL